MKKLPEHIEQALKIAHKASKPPMPIHRRSTDFANLDLVSEVDFKVYKKDASV